MHLFAVAWMVYTVYEVALWPLGTIYLGLAGHSIVWSAIGAVPLVLYNYGSDRRRQREKERPETPQNTAIVVLVVFLIAMFGLYYLGVAVSLLWG